MVRVSVGDREADAVPPEDVIDNEMVEVKEGEFPLTVSEVWLDLVGEVDAVPDRTRLRVVVYEGDKEVDTVLVCVVDRLPGEMEPVIGREWEEVTEREVVISRDADSVIASDTVSVEHFRCCR